jgi:hypothetical protein
MYERTDDRGRASGTYGLAAFLAELRAELIGRATSGAHHFQPRPTLLTKHRISGALVLTPGTLHPALTSQVGMVGTVRRT